MRIIHICAVVGATLALAAPASAIVWTFNAPINQGQVVPPTGSPAAGLASGTYDDVTNTLNITANVTGFLYARTAAHIHGPAPPGSNNVPVFDLGVAGAGNNWNNPNTVFVLSGVQEVDFLNGLYYVQVHTTDSPGGAVRGQLNPVPEPASMIALGMGAVVLLRRRLKRA